jgi:hypothetical protein
VLADSVLAMAGESTEGLRVPGVNLGALRVLGGITTFAGASISAYGEFRILQREITLGRHSMAWISVSPRRVFSRRRHYRSPSVTDLEGPEGISGLRCPNC